MLEPVSDEENRIHMEFQAHKEIIIFLGNDYDHCESLEKIL